MPLPGTTWVSFPSAHAACEVWAGRADATDPGIAFLSSNGEGASFPLPGSLHPQWVRGPGTLLVSLLSISGKALPEVSVIVASLGKPSPVWEEERQGPSRQRC